jgi:hypothetical protein
MKVFWAEGVGAVLTSANLSTNALGSGNLHEVGVLLPSSAIDIDRLKARLHAKPVTSRALQQLERKHRRFSTGRYRLRDTSLPPSFLDWYESPGRSPWKMGFWDSEGSLAKAARSQSESEFGVRAPNDFISCREGQYSEQDWILTFRVTRRGVSEIAWMFVDFVARVTPSDRPAYSKAYQWQAVQVYGPSYYPAKPFAISPGFKSAFEAALRGYGLETVVRRDITGAPVRLINLVRQQMRRGH